MKSFNLDEAKAGALFCGPTTDPSRLTYKYVGLMSDGRIAFERSDGILACQTAGSLRMAVEKKVRYVTPWALWGNKEALVDSLHRLRQHAHRSVERCMVCAACQHSGMTDAENPILRIEWEE